MGAGMAASQNSMHMQDVLKQLRNPNVRVGDGRRHKRAKCFLLATVQHNKYTCECIVEDMSVGGCKVNNTDGQLAIGQSVVISIPEQNMSLNGMVMWVRGKAAGLCFNLSI
ncbi:PilZ domain-containing protein [Pleomorphomonas diazotrophica]|nr:PilZ domain-containing protein [Pleomorphomonas diazotrophica]